MIVTGQQHSSTVEESIALHLSQQLGILQRLTQLTNQELTNIPKVLEIMVEEVCHTIANTHFCLMVLYNSQSQELELTASAGIGVEKLPFFKSHGGLESSNHLWEWQEKSITSNIPTPELGLLVQVFTTGVPQLFQGSGEKPECVVDEFPAFCAFSPASMYAVAIKSAQARHLGVLVIGNWEHPQAFDVATQKLLDAVGEIVAIAINNANMIQALAEREKQLAQQNEILLAQNRELEKNRHQIRLQNLQLLEAGKLKSQFLATTSHELRTPLNVILGLSQVLLRQRTSTLTEPQVDMMQRILHNGNHLLTIIEDMLHFANLEAGRLSFQPTEFNLSTLILTTVAEHRSLADDKFLDLQVEINLAYPLIVNDSARLKQVLVKLLLNAIKFTETGIVAVKVWEISSDRIAIAIQDTGIGIAESELEHIFEQFRQVDQSHTRQYNGIGLGLAITRSLVEIMQGSIKVTSKPGQGSTFYIELPKQINFAGLGDEIHTSSKPIPRMIL